MVSYITKASETFACDPCDVTNFIFIAVYFKAETFLNTFWRRAETVLGQLQMSELAVDQAVTRKLTICLTPSILTQFRATWKL